MDLSGNEKIEAKVTKEKKPRSEKQKEATAKALAVLKERRDKKEKDAAEEKESKLIAKQKTRERKKKPDDPLDQVVTARMMKDELKKHFESIPKPAEPTKLPPPPKLVHQETPPPPAPAPAPVLPPRPISKEKLKGRDLLDALFFK
jgi:hypothetical protein